MDRPKDIKKTTKIKTFNKRHFYDLENIASATECTGLIPAARGEDALDDTLDEEDEG